MRLQDELAWQVRERIIGAQHFYLDLIGHKSQEKKYETPPRPPKITLDMRLQAVADLGHELRPSLSGWQCSLCRQRGTRRQLGTWATLGPCRRARSSANRPTSAKTQEPRRRLTCKTYDPSWHPPHHQDSVSSLLQGRGRRSWLKQRLWANTYDPDWWRAIMQDESPQYIGELVGRYSWDESHRFGCIHGVIFCWRCGGWGIGRPHLLCRPCREYRKPGGLQALRRLARGKLPGTLKSWPTLDDSDRPTAVRLYSDPGTMHLYRTPVRA